MNKDRSDAEQIGVVKSFCTVVNPPVVTPGNPLLVYRDSMYCFMYDKGKAVGSAMVVSTLK
jgi:hypothetical protein